MTLERPMFPPTRRAFINAIAALPIAAAAPAAAGKTPDAELIELGARFEPLVDRYYVAQRRWSGSLARAHAEHDREFGDPADRNYEYPPEIVAAFSDSCERSGANEADETLSAVDAEMKQLISKSHQRVARHLDRGTSRKGPGRLLGGRSVVRRQH
jgi:hypothetical protein